MSTQFTLKIADFLFNITSKSQYPIVLDNGFQSFVIQTIKTPDYQIDVFDFLIPVPNDVTSVYQAKQKSNVLWEIFRFGEELFFEINHPTSFKLQQRAVYNRKRKMWRIYVNPDFSRSIQGELNPLSNPMAPLIWYYLSTEESLILIHGAGIYMDGIGRVFSGVSGIGKSTMAEIWRNIGAQVINDDRLIIRIVKDGSIVMFNTPMTYSDSYKSTPLNHLYLPFHSKDKCLEKLTGAKGISQLFASCIQHGYEKENILHHLNVIERILMVCSLSKLGVVPTTQMCSYILENEV
jgi:hypothetical protein